MENKELLTGRGKADFEAWFEEKYADTVIDLKTFYLCESVYQQGVLLEYFRERGIEIEITKWEDERREYDNIRTNKYYWIIYVDNEFKSLDHECKTYEMQSDYSTTFTTAIQKANEIYNGKELK